MQPTSNSSASSSPNSSRRSSVDVETGNLPPLNERRGCGQLFFRVVGVRENAAELPETCGINGAQCVSCQSDFQEVDLAQNTDDTVVDLDGYESDVDLASYDYGLDDDQGGDGGGERVVYPDDQTLVVIDETPSSQSVVDRIRIGVRRVRDYAVEHPVRAALYGTGGLLLAAGAGYGIYALAHALSESNDSNNANATDAGTDNSNPVRHRRDLGDQTSYTAAASSESTQESENLHHSVIPVVRDLANTTTRQAFVRMEFKDEACQQATLTRLFTNPDYQVNASDNLADFSDIAWSSNQAGRHATTLKMNRDMLERALGESIDNPDCVLRLSAEPIFTRRTQAEVRRAAAARDLFEQVQNAEQQAASSSGEFCIQVMGERLGERHIECAAPYSSTLMQNTTLETTPPPTSTASENTSTANDSVSIAIEDSTDLCLERIALFSDGIRDSSVAARHVRQTVRFDQLSYGRTQNTLGYRSSMTSYNGSQPFENALLRAPGNQTMAEGFADAALRACPNLQIDDYRVAVGVTGVNSSEVVASTITGEFFTQALDHAARQPDGESPQRIIVLDPDPAPNYSPDTALISDYVSLLNTKGTGVDILGAESNNWLSKIQNVTVTDSLVEAVAKAGDTQASSSQPHHSGIASAAGVVAGITGTAALVMVAAEKLRRRRHKAEMSARRQAAEQQGQEMQPLQHEDGEMPSGSGAGSSNQAVRPPRTRAEHARHVQEQRDAAIAARLAHYDESSDEEEAPSQQQARVERVQATQTPFKGKGKGKGKGRSNQRSGLRSHSAIRFAAPQPQERAGLLRPRFGEPLNQADQEQQQSSSDDD